MTERVVERLRELDQGTLTVAAGLATIEIWPPQEHMHFDVVLSTGMLATTTVGAPGIHGVVTGMHGIGVSTPSAAAVAAATVGFESDMHIPNGGMFASGLQSMIVATGTPPIIVLF